MKHKMLSLAFAIVFLVALAGVGYAACTITAPAASGTLSGANAILNVTSCDQHMDNCSVTGSSAKTGDTITTFWLYNNTGALAMINGTFNTYSYGDAADYTFTATCANESVTQAASISGITIDNTAPTISSCYHLGVTAANTTETVESTATVYCTVVNASSCSVYWKDTTENAMASDTSDTDCTFTSTSSYAAAGTTATCVLSGATDGYNTWNFACNDGADTTTGTNYKFLRGGFSPDQQAEQDNGSTMQQYLVVLKNLSDNKTMLLLIMAGAVVVIFGAAWFFVLKK